MSRGQEREVVRVDFAVICCLSKIERLSAEIFRLPNRQVEFHLRWISFSRKSKEVYPRCIFEGHVRCSMQRSAFYSNSITLVADHLAN